ncbi:binding protein component of ABC transporter [Gluconobacter morbifer G707]|uniref:Binding protein component of ABC transporter n=1 Tax=Gluconobacter morbifer G707 TaxID=1088869 RepID=G6XJ10_9PROT|nr:binding protein component of ABC transporter [Gluconobacter morbifer G707]
MPGWTVPEGSVAAHAVINMHGDTRLTEWDGQIATLEKGVHASTPIWTAIMLDGEQLDVACTAGWLHPIEGSGNCGIPAGVLDIALAWDRSRLTTAPDWRDFWDVARHPGRRGLRFGARTTLEIALLGDGVAPQDIYSTLSTQAGVERAFRRLEQLRPYIVWWRTPDDAGHIMEQSGALMTSAPIPEISSVSSRVQAGAASSIFVAGTQQILRMPVFWAIPGNLSADSARQTQERLKMLSPRLDDMPDMVADAHITTLSVSDQFWITHGSELERQFQDWFGGQAP